MNDLADASIGSRLGYTMSHEFIMNALADIEAERKQESQTRSLSTGMQDRRLQEDVCQLYLNSSIFRNNAQGPTQGVTTYGIITLRTVGHVLSIDDCLFAENIFGIPEINVSCWAMAGCFLAGKCSGAS